MNLAALLARCRDFIAEEHRSTLECATSAVGTVDQDEATQEWLAEAQGLLTAIDEELREMTA